MVNGRLIGPGVTIAVEVGFHAEHRAPADNQEVLDRLLAAERSWRKALGAEAEAAPFLGRDSWRRLSETWVDADLGDPDLALEVAGRLVDYATALEPVRRR